tara:strand:+ start:11659 stop:12624 length:966 start_codon:yes stop_codon:yes gene_type:complete
MNPENLKETLKKSRPNAKDNTIKQYESNLRKLQNMAGDTKGYDFLKKPDAVMKLIEDKHFTTIRNYINAVVILLMALNSDDKYDKLLEEYISIREDLSKQYDDQNSSGKISEKQSKSFVPLKDVVDMINRMGDDLKGYKKKDELSAKDMMLLQVYIIFQIHVRLPMRNDLAGAESIKKTQYNKLSEEDKKAKNYLVVEKASMFFVLNKFKTSAKYEELRFDVPKDLEKLLRSYLRINGMGVLFKSSTGKELSRNQLSQTLIKYSKRYMDGKSISTTMLRKIVLSDLFADKNKKQKEMAKITGHSVETMNDVYIKDKPEADE